MKEKKERVLTLKDKLQVLENNIVYFPKLEKLDEWDRNLVQEELSEISRNVKDIRQRLERTKGFFNIEFEFLRKEIALLLESKFANDDETEHAILIASAISKRLDFMEGLLSEC